MFNILDELKEMISLLGGDPDEAKDIGYAVMTLKKLVVVAAPKLSNVRREENKKVQKD